MKKIVIFYPYDTKEKAFSGGVAKVIVSNIIAVHMNGDHPIMMLPKGNSGLISFVKEKCPYCEIAALDFQSIALYSDTKNILIRARLIAGNLYKFITGRKHIKAYLEKVKPDVIHYHETVTYPFLHYYKNAKVIMHLHSFRNPNQSFISKRLFNALNNHADIVISPTLSIKKAFQPLLNKEIKIVMTPYLDLGSSNNEALPCPQMEEQIRDGKKIFSFIGRICRIKRLECCLKAMAMLDKSDLDKMKYVIIGGCNTEGDKEYKAELEKIIKDNNLENYVSFVGFINPIEKALPYIDYGVMLTESEAMPMVGIEYMRFNIPTIGFDAPGINDFVKTNVTGFKVNNGDVEDLSKTLKHVLNDSDIPVFEEIIPSIFANYSIEKFAEVLKEIYS